MNLLEVSLLATQLEREYKETIAYFYDVMNKMFYDDILSVIKDTKKRLYQNTHSTMVSIDNLRNKYR